MPRLNQSNVYYVRHNRRYGVWGEAFAVGWSRQRVLWASGEGGKGLHAKTSVWDGNGLYQAVEGLFVLSYFTTVEISVALKPLSVHMMSQTSPVGGGVQPRCLQGASSPVAFSCALVNFWPAVHFHIYLLDRLKLAAGISRHFMAAAASTVDLSVSDHVLRIFPVTCVTGHLSFQGDK